MHVRQTPLVPTDGAEARASSRRRALLLVCLTGGIAPALHAQEARPAYPSRPVRLVVAFAPGGPADIVGRLISQRLGEGLGQGVVVENRGGAGGSIAAQQVARMPADGQVVLLTTSAIAIAPGLSANPGFDLERDFVPVALLAAQPSVLVAHPDVQASNLQELIALARGGKLNFGTAGNGTSPHLAAEYLFKVLARVNVTHVPFNGGGPALQAVAGGNLELVNVALSPAIPLIRAGKLKAIAVTGARRAAALPEVPTVAESGYPGFEDRTWVGLFLPAGAPPAVTARLNAEIDKLLQLPDIRERLAAIAFEPLGGTPQAFGQFVRAETAKFARFVREAGIKAE
jgi:tripartite-type tricarboxylate transporter receptor subunit TctC